MLATYSERSFKVENFTGKQINNLVYKQVKWRYKVMLYTKNYLIYTNHLQL